MSSIGAVLLALLPGCGTPGRPPVRDVRAATGALRAGPIHGTFTDGEGRTVRYQVSVPDALAAGEPHGVLLFFPWDGGGASYVREARIHAALAAEHHLVSVSVRQPEGTRCWWAPEVEGYARLVDALLRERLLGAYGLDPDRVFLTGMSGGADFAAAFPAHVGYRYGGGVVALCGGDVPRTDGGDCATEANPPEAPLRSDLTPRQLAAVRYDFALTADDPLLAPSLAAAALYRGAGFTHVRHRVVAGTGHCGFAEGWEGLDALAAGLDYVDARTNP